MNSQMIFFLNGNSQTWRIVSCYRLKFKSSQFNCKRLPSHTGQGQACSRITRLFVRLFVRHHAENGPIHRKMVVDCPLVIISKVKLFFRPDKTRKKEWMVQPVFCIVDAGSCLRFVPSLFWKSKTHHLWTEVATEVWLTKVEDLLFIMLWRRDSQELFRL